MKFVVFLACGFLFRGDGVSQRVLHSDWDEPVPLRRCWGEGVSQNFCKGKIGSLLICVYFTHCQVWMGMLWFTVTVTTEATPCPSTGNEPIHLSKCLKIPLCAFHGLLIQVFWQNVVVCSLKVCSSGLILFKSPNTCLEALFLSLRGRWEEGWSTTEQGSSTSCIWGFSVLGHSLKFCGRI